MFNDINGSWLDGSFFNVLRYIDGMHLFFMKQTRILAMICFALSFGISCVKMVLGATDVNKVLTQALMSIVTYLLMIFLFPHIMMNTQKIVSDLAYGAVFSQGADIKLESKYGKEEKFFEFLNELGTDKEGNTIWSVNGNGNNARKNINLQITNKETGIISLNKLFQMIIVTFKALWKSLDVKNIVDFFKHLPDFLMVIIISLSYLLSLSGAVVNYAMVVIQYAFLYGMGVLFIPLMLWEGTKHAFEKLCGSIYNIGVRLLVVQTSLYLAAMANIDILKNMFVLSGGKIDFMQGLEFYISIFFMVIFIKILVDQAPAIADFLCGGQPTLNFKDFASAVATGVAAGAVAAKAGSTIKGASATGAALSGALKSAGGVLKTVIGGGKETGGGAGSQSAAILAGSEKMGQSAVQGGAKVQDKNINTQSRGAQPAQNGVSSGLPSSRGGAIAVPAGKGGAVGGIIGGGLSTQSNHSSEKVQGMSEQYRGNTVQGGKDSETGGGAKVLRNSVVESGGTGTGGKG